jgi:hypothetical protein
MLSIHDLLEDSRYKEFFCKVPALPPHMKVPEAKPYRLFVRYKGEDRWRTRDFHTYKEAFLKLKSLMPRVADAAINSKAVPARPPHRVVKIKGKYQTTKAGKFVLDAAGQKKQLTRIVDWKPRMPADEFQEHFWCPYCRRPTVFNYFVSHHALSNRKLGGMPLDPTIKRCCICGASERIVVLRGA